MMPVKEDATPRHDNSARRGGGLQGLLIRPADGRVFATVRQLRAHMAAKMLESWAWFIIDSGFPLTQGTSSGQNRGRFMLTPY